MREIHAAGSVKGRTTIPEKQTEDTCWLDSAWAVQSRQHLIVDALLRLSFSTCC